MNESDPRGFWRDDFAKEILGLADEAHEFEPILHYDSDGDCIEFISERDSYDAERINSLITVYHSTSSERLIGARIKGVMQLIRRRPYVSIAVKDGKIRLDFLIVAGGLPDGPWGSEEKPALSLRYEKVIRELADLASTREIEVPQLCEA